MPQKFMKKNRVSYHVCNKTEHISQYTIASGSFLKNMLLYNNEMETDCVEQSFA